VKKIETDENHELPKFSVVVPSSIFNKFATIKLP